MKSIKFFIIAAIILSFTSCANGAGINGDVTPKNNSQWVPGKIYFIPGNVSQGEAYRLENGQVAMYNQTVPTVDKEWAWTIVQFIDGMGQLRTEPALYRISKYKTYRDIPHGYNNQGYSAMFSFGTPVGFYPGSGNSQNIFIRID